jgi:membrane-bound lytic murein transglycosylase B
MLNNNQAIYSVGSFLKKHHWKSGKDIIVPAKLKNIDYTKLQIAKTNYPKPNLSLQTLQANGVEPATTNNFKQDDKVAFIEMVKSDGAEYWVGSDNFFVITRYNNSNNYALYVYLLSEEIKKSYNA